MPDAVKKWITVLSKGNKTTRDVLTDLYYENPWCFERIMHLYKK